VYTDIHKAWHLTPSVLALPAFLTFLGFPSFHPWLSVLGLPSFLPSFLATRKSSTCHQIEKDTFTRSQDKRASPTPVDFAGDGQKPCAKGLQRRPEGSGGKEEETAMELVLDGRARLPLGSQRTGAHLGHYICVCVCVCVYPCVSCVCMYR
jgi:hypothetical protein